MDIILALATAGAGAIKDDAGDPILTTTTPVPSRTMPVELPQADDHHGHQTAGPLLRRTAHHAPRASATERAALPPRQWRCRVCQVECGGRDVFRQHCMSDEHYFGLQVFVLCPDLFAGRMLA